MRKLSKPIKVKLLDGATSYFDEIDEKIKTKFFNPSKKLNQDIKVSGSNIWKMKFGNLENVILPNFIEFLHFGIQL